MVKVAYFKNNWRTVGKGLLTRPLRVEFDANCMVKRFFPLDVDIISCSEIRVRKLDSPKLWLMFLLRDQNDCLPLEEYSVSETVVKGIFEI